MHGEHRVRHVEAEMPPDVIQHDDGTIEFELKSTDKWMSAAAASKASERSVNLPVLWRHKHPAKEIAPIIGRITKSRVEDGEIYNTYRIGEDFVMDAQTTARDWIKARWNEGKTVGASVGCVYVESAGDAVSVYPYEYSITPIPACKTCQKENSMSVEDEKPADEIQKELDATAEKAKEIKADVEAKMTALEKEREAFLAEKAAYESEKATKVLSMEDMKVKMAEMEASYKERFVELERKPYLEKIATFESIPTKHVLKYLEKECPKVLKMIVDEEPAPAPPIITMTVDKERSSKLTKEAFMATMDPAIAVATKETAWEIYNGA